MIKFVTLLILAVFYMIANAQAEAEPSDKLSKGEERQHVLVDNDLQGWFLKQFWRWCGKERWKCMNFFINYCKLNFEEVEAKFLGLKIKEI
jgi:hypothetical protein